jgi:hypothetical protein
LLLLGIDGGLIRPRRLYERPDRPVNRLAP